MAGFDPDQFLAEDSGGGFDPDKFLAGEVPPPVADAQPAPQQHETGPISAAISGALTAIPGRTDAEALAEWLVRRAPGGEKYGPPLSFSDSRKYRQDIQNQLATDHPVAEGAGQAAGLLGAGMAVPGGAVPSAVYGGALGASAGDDVPSRLAGAAGGAALGGGFGALGKAAPKAAMGLAAGLGGGAAMFGDKIGMSDADRVAAGVGGAAAAGIGAYSSARGAFAGPRDEYLAEALSAAAAKQAEAQQGSSVVDAKLKTINLRQAEHKQDADSFATWLAKQKKPGPGELPKRSLRSDIQAVRGDMGNRAQAMQQVAQTTDALGMQVPEDVAEGLNVAGANHLKNKTPEARTFAKGMDEVRRTSAERVLPARAQEHEDAVKALIAKRETAASRPIGKKRYTPADDAMYAERKSGLELKKAKADRLLGEATAKNSEEGVLAEGKKQSQPMSVLRGAGRVAFGGPIGKAEVAAQAGSAPVEAKAYWANKLAGPKSAAERGQDMGKAAASVGKQVDLERLRRAIKSMTRLDNED